MAVEDIDLQPVPEELLMRPRVSLPEGIEEDVEEEPSSFDKIKTEFDPRYREPFIGLLYLGHLSKEVTLYGHTFSLSTPTQREKLEAGVLHKRFVNTIAGELAWAAITVALYLTEVDGNELPEPIGPAAATRVQDRYNWVVDNIRQDLITRLFQECLILDSEVAATLAELERLGN